MRQALERILEKARKDAPPGRHLPAASRAELCSVPLIEMKLPDNVNFTMKTIGPPHATAPMPTAKMTAPPCNR
jgi:hypothetical protein